MRLQHALRDKIVITNIADFRFLASVQPQVHFQTVTLRERLFTERAFVRFLSCVPPFVQLQRGLIRETLRAHATLVRFEAFVHSYHVLLKADFRTELLTAHITNETTVFTVQLVHVHRQILLADEFRITKFAFDVPFFSVVFVVLQSVVIQAAFVVARPRADLADEGGFALVSRVYVQVETRFTVEAFVAKLTENAEEFHVSFLMRY